MITTSSLLSAARAQIGTPFRHQGRKPFQALDCAGLVKCAANAVGIDVFDVESYGRRPDNGLLEATLDAQPCLERVFREPMAGDILLMRFNGDPQHLALCAGETIIHAYADVRKVCEHNFTDEWKQRVVRVYRFIEVEE